MAPVNPTSPSRLALARPHADEPHDDLDAELERLTAASRELLASFGAPPAAVASAAVDPEEVALLRLENAELRSRVEELESLFNSAGSNDTTWEDRQREYEALLEEKSEVIRALHQKIRELQDGPARAVERGPAQPDENALQLRDALEQQRRQLQDDEEAMMAQLREMEMVLSKDRADLARQRQEIQRLQAEVAREIEQASRDPGLRERLLSLRRPGDKARPTSQVSLSEPTPIPQTTPATVPVKGSSGIFRRIFG